MFFIHISPVFPVCCFSFPQFSARMNTPFCCWVSLIFSSPQQFFSFSLSYVTLALVKNMNPLFFRIFLSFFFFLEIFDTAKNKPKCPHPAAFVVGRRGINKQGTTSGIFCHQRVSEVLWGKIKISQGNKTMEKVLCEIMFTKQHAQLESCEWSFIWSKMRTVAWERAPRFWETASRRQQGESGCMQCNKGRRQCEHQRSGIK